MNAGFSVFVLETPSQAVLQVVTQFFRVLKCTTDEHRFTKGIDSTTHSSLKVEVVEELFGLQHSIERQQVVVDGFVFVLQLLDAELQIADDCRALRTNRS